MVPPAAVPRDREMPRARRLRAPALSAPIALPAVRVSVPVPQFRRHAAPAIRVASASMKRLLVLRELVLRLPVRRPWHPNSAATPSRPSGVPLKNIGLLRAAASPTIERASAVGSACNNCDAPPAPRLCATYSDVSLTGKPAVASAVALRAVKLDRKSACCCGVASAARAGAPGGLNWSHVPLMAWNAPVALLPWVPEVHGLRSPPLSMRCNAVTYAGDAPGGNATLTC